MCVGSDEGSRRARFGRARTTSKALRGPERGSVSEAKAERNELAEACRERDRTNDVARRAALLIVIIGAATSAVRHVSCAIVTDGHCQRHGRSARRMRNNARRENGEQSERKRAGKASHVLLYRRRLWPVEMEGAAPHGIVLVRPTGWHRHATPNVFAASFQPSTVVRYGTNISPTAVKNGSIGLNSGPLGGRSPFENGHSLDAAFVIRTTHVDTRDTGPHGRDRPEDEAQSDPSQRGRMGADRAAVAEADEAGPQAGSALEMRALPPETRPRPAACRWSAR